jgi:pyruvate decarboxylase
MLLHHTLGNGNFDVFSQMSAQICCAVAKLNDPHEIATQIDHALRECWVKSRPVYMMLPTDMVERKIEGARLKKPIDLSEPPNHAEREDFVVDSILQSIYSAKSVIILVDACAIRHRVVPEVHGLVEKTQFPVFVTPMGKGAVDETSPLYGGVYAGGASTEEVKRAVEGADLILMVGAIKSDFNTAGFSYRTSQLNTIDFHSTHCVVRYSEFPGVRMAPVLRKVMEKIDSSRLPKSEVPRLENVVPVTAGDSSSQIITHDWFWPRVGGFLKQTDVVVTETGTSNFGIWETRFPGGVTALSQVLWGSIGWSVGACQGAALAARDSEASRRTILFVGDGSFQLTAQEVSTMIRHKLNVIM